MNLRKDQALLEMLSRANLQARGWETVDYWDADLCAIGIRSQQCPGRLVYVSTFNKSPGLFDYECEGPGREGNPYTTVKSGKDASLDELLKAIGEHLA